VKQYESIDGLTYKMWGVRQLSADHPAGIVIVAEEGGDFIIPAADLLAELAKVVDFTVTAPRIGFVPQWKGGRGR
jgi:hypothetical protein